MRADRTLALVFQATPSGSISTNILIICMVLVAALSFALLYLRTSPRRVSDQRLLATDGMLTPSALRAYALALLDTHRLDDAFDTVDVLLSRLPGDAQFRALYGALLSTRGEHMLALSEFEHATQLLRQDKNTLPAYRVRQVARLLLVQAAELNTLGKSREAEARAQEGLALDAAIAGDRKDILRSLIDAVRDSELERSAFERLSEWESGRAGARAPGFEDPSAAVHFYRRALTQYPTDNRILANYAQALHASGDHQAAERAYQDALRQDPRDPWTHYEFGTLLWRLDRHPEARSKLSTAAQLGQRNAAIRGTYALLLLHQHELDEAEQELMAAVTLRQDVWILARLYGRVLLAQGKQVEAAQAYGEAERLGATDAAFRLDYADLLARLGQLQLAETQYRLAARAQQAVGVSHARYGAFLLEQARLDEAEEQLRQALISSDAGEAHITLARLYLLERRLNEASQPLQVALERQPQSPAIQECHAEWLLLRGQAAQAHHITQQLIEQGGTHGSLYLLLGGALLGMNRQLEAQAALRQCVRADPALPTRLLARARALRDLGYISAAREAVAQALALQPNWPDALAAQHALSQEQAPSAGISNYDARRTQG